MVYTIEVSECITSQFEVDALSSHEAMKIIARKYYDEELTVGKFLSMIQDERNRKPIFARPQTIIDKKRSEGLLKRLLSH